VARVGGVQGIHQTLPAGPRSQDVGFGYFVLSLVDALRAGGRFTVWEDPAINSVATPIVAAEIGALLGRAIDRGADGVLHFAGGTAVTRRDLAEATCAVFGLDESLLDFAPPPDAARLPAPVPYDTSMEAAATMTLLGTTAWDVTAQLGSLERELTTGAPVPLTQVGMTTMETAGPIRQSPSPPRPRCSISICRTSTGCAGSTTQGFAVEIWDWRPPRTSTRCMATA
jgi:dTDP-4-dehydrorhamnose reductase